MSFGRSMNHDDVVVSVLISEPFQSWEEWRLMEDVRQTLSLDPQNLIDSLEEVRRQFSDRVLTHMTRIGRRLLCELIEGDLMTTKGYWLCVERCPQLPYFERTGLGADTMDASACIDKDELTGLFFRYPWFFYLIFTDPTL